MRNKETGEFELVVGDKQLLSGFFIGVLLLAVVFAMGYVLGQNSPHSARSDEKTTVTAVPSQPRPQPAAPLASAPAPQPGSDPQQIGAVPEETPQPATQAAKEDTETRRPAAPASADASPGASSDSSGSYWQVTAQASRTSAEAVSQTLKEQGFPVAVRTGPSGLSVVWVGPYNDKDSLAKAKTRLENAGFSGLLLRRL